MKAKFAVLVKNKYPLKIIDLSIPKLEKGQVLVKLKYTSICRSQIMEIDGLRGKDKWIPHLLGHEGSGTVVNIGKKVKYFKIEDNVIVTWIKTEGIDTSGVIYKYNNKIINSGSSTSFSSYAIISENRLIKKPDFLTFREACYFGCAIPTGAGMVIKEQGMKQQSNILVIGLGGIGLSVLMCLKLNGYNSIDVFDTNRIKLNKLKKDKFLKNINFYSKEKELKLCSYDFVFESAGLIKTIEFGFKILRDTGKLIFASHPEFSKKIRINPHDLIKGKRIIGTWGGGIKTKKDFNKIFNIFKRNKNILGLLKSKEYKFEDINIAIKNMKKGLEIRPMIKF